jgi:hypothetical protein
MPYSPASQKALHVRRLPLAEKDMMSYITERSATTHIAVHPELRLVA